MIIYTQNRNPVHKYIIKSFFLLKHIANKMKWRVEFIIYQIWVHQNLIIMTNNSGATEGRRARPPYKQILPPKTQN